MKYIKPLAIALAALTLFITPLSASAATIKVEKKDAVMPTVDDLDEAKYYSYLVEGTDQWNDKFKEMGEEYGVDPVFIKVVCSIESCGIVSARNGCYYGPFQIGSAFGYDNERLMSDMDYALECAIEVFYIKGDDIVRKGMEPTAYNVAKWYNGGSSYAKFVCTLYEDLSGKDGYSTLVLTYDEDEP